MLNLILGLATCLQPADVPSVPEADTAAIESAYIIKITTAAMRDLCQPVIDELLVDAREKEADLIVLRVDAQQELPSRLIEQDAPELYFTFWWGMELAGHFDRQIKLWDAPPRVVVWLIHSEGPATQFALAVHERYFAPDAVVSWGDEPPGPSLNPRANGPVTLRTRRNLLTWLAERSGVDRDVIERLAGVVPGRDGSLPPGVEEPIPGSSLGVEEAIDAGIARGTAATLDELLDLIASGAEPAVDTQSASAILEEWSAGLAEAEASIVDLYGKYQQAQERETLEGSEDEQRRAAREDQATCLVEMLRHLRRYKSVLDPHGEVTAQFEFELEARRDSGTP